MIPDVQIGRMSGVSPFSLVHDRDRAVRVMIDRELTGVDRVPPVCRAGSEGCGRESGASDPARAGCRYRFGQMPYRPADRIPLGSNAFLSVAWTRESALLLKE